MKTPQLSFAVSGALAAFGLAACGKTTPSKVAFLPGQTQTQVVVEAKDLNDTFLFGAIVTDADAATSSLLGASAMLAQEVQLGLSQSNQGNLLAIQSVSSGQTLMSFAVSSQESGQTLVDFANSPSDIQVLSTIDSSLSGGINSASVSAVAQTKDSMTVDVAYAGSVPTDSGSTVSGQFSVRYWWKRRQPNPAFVQRPNVSGLGFFTTANQAAGQGLRDGTISRLDVDQAPISFTLSGFPTDFVPAATQGIKAWEAALGPNTINVNVGTANIGDPNTIVVRWYSGLPLSVPFAGLTYTAADPETGERGASAVLINGTVDYFQKIFTGTQTAYQAYKKGTTSAATLASTSSDSSATSQPLSLKLGGMLLTQSDLLKDDAPVFLPGLPDETESADAFIKGYFRAVIMHEVGHVMGLRHNFRGSLHTDAATGQASSIMDYANNQLGDKAVQIGSYDLAAMRYGYFGETPAQTLDYCSDEDQETDALCNQFDAGADLASYFHQATQQLVYFISHYDVDGKLGLTGTVSTFKNYYKLTQLSSPQQAAAQANLQTDLAAIQQAVGQTAVQTANLKALRERAVVLTGGTYTPPPM